MTGVSIGVAMDAVMGVVTSDFTGVVIGDGTYNDTGVALAVIAGFNASVMVVVLVTVWQRLSLDFRNLF